MNKDTSDSNKSIKDQSEKYESEMLSILEELKNDSNVAKAIDRIIEDLIDVDIDEIQSKLIILVRKYLEMKNTKTTTIGIKKENFKDEEIAHNIAKFTRDLIKKHENIDPDITEDNSIKDDKYSITKKTKMSIKKTLKEFAIYEIYKVMNPRRIAGETKKDNYAHNMMMGGHKRASKYEGGRESDLKSYGKTEVRRIENASKLFKKSDHGMSI